MTLDRRSTNSDSPANCFQTHRPAKYTGDWFPAVERGMTSPNVPQMHHAECNSSTQKLSCNDDNRTITAIAITITVAVNRPIR